MTRRERVISAINHQQTDFAPFHISFTHHEYEKVAEYLKDKDFVSKIGNHLSAVYYDVSQNELSPGSGYWKDDFGVVWNHNGADKDIGVIEGLVLPEPDMSGYKFPEIDEIKLRGEFVKLMGSDDDTFKYGAIGFSLFERAWTLRGMENLMVDMVLNPEFVDGLLDAITDFNIRIIDIAMEYDIDCFHFGDDWGQQKGLIMGPDYWRRFIKPRVARMYQRIKSKGKFVSQHSCGDIHDIFRDLIEIGLDVYQTFQPEIYDLPKVKREYGKHLTFNGGISTQRLLPFATPAEIKRVASETIKLMGEGGGYIAAPTHDLPGDIPAENVVALIDAFQNQE